MFYTQTIKGFELPKILGAAFWTEMEPISINIPFAQPPSSVIPWGVETWAANPSLKDSNPLPHLSDGRAKDCQTWASPQNRCQCYAKNHQRRWFLGMACLWNRRETTVWSVDDVDPFLNFLVLQSRPTSLLAKINLR